MEKVFSLDAKLTDLIKDGIHTLNDIDYILQLEAIRNQLICGAKYAIVDGERDLADRAIMTVIYIQAAIEAFSSEFYFDS